MSASEVYVVDASCVFAVSKVAGKSSIVLVSPSGALAVMPVTDNAAAEALGKMRSGKKAAQTDRK